MSYKWFNDRIIERITEALNDDDKAKALELARELERNRDAWVQSAAEFHNGSLYYQGLLDRIGEMIGKEAYICDDGSLSDSVLRAKIPQLVKAILDNAP